MAATVNSYFNRSLRVSDHSTITIPNAVSLRFVTLISWSLLAIPRILSLGVSPAGVSGVKGCRILIKNASILGTNPYVACRQARFMCSVKRRHTDPLL